MLLAGGLQSSSLDMPTLSLVAVCIAGLLGLFLIIDWMQQRNVRALAWWGSAYLIGASAMALGTHAGAVYQTAGSLAGRVDVPRLRHGLERRPAVPRPSRAAVCDLHRRRCCGSVSPAFRACWKAAMARSLGALIVPVYTFFIAMELWRERRRTRYSRAAAIVVPCLHAGIFLVPLAMRVVLAGRA